MKIVFSYILFFVLAVRPLYNIGYITYYELNIDYIIETYCINKKTPELKCNGKCHLATQLAVNAQDNPDETSYLNTLFETFLPVYFQKDTFNIKWFFLKNNIQNNWNYSNFITSTYQENLDRPPEV